MGLQYAAGTDCKTLLSQADYSKSERPLYCTFTHGSTTALEHSAFALQQSKTVQATVKQCHSHMVGPLSAMMVHAVQQFTGLQWTEHWLDQTNWQATSYLLMRDSWSWISFDSFTLCMSRLYRTQKSVGSQQLVGHHVSATYNAAQMHMRYTDAQ